MNFPAQFLGAIPELEVHLKPVPYLDASVSGRHRGYKADLPGKKAKAMHALAGLGAFRVCDYYLPLGARMLVIEDTELKASVRDQSAKSAAALVESHADELRLKAYGSMLVLYRLHVKRFPGNAEWAAALDQMPCQFWVVATDLDSQDSEGDDIALDALVEHVVMELAKKLPGRLKPPFERVEIAGVWRFNKEVKAMIEASPAS